MGKPRFTDGHRFQRPYVSSKEMGEGYLQRRFKEIEEQQKAAATERLQKCIAMRRKTK